MFSIDNDMTISITRGDVATIPVSAGEEGFKLGDIIRIKVFEKKNCANVIFQKDFGVAEETESMELLLTRYETKIGETINKPTTYWYEIELNPDTSPNTIVGYDEDGPKLFVLYPEGEDVEYIPPTEEELGPIDYELSLTSKKPIANLVVAKLALEQDNKIDESAERSAKALENGLATEKAERKSEIAIERDERASAIANEKSERKAEIAVERARINNLATLNEGSTTGDAELIDARVSYDGTVYPTLGEALRTQSGALKTDLVNELSWNRIKFSLTGFLRSSTVGKPYKNTISTTEGYSRTDIIPYASGDIYIHEVRTTGFSLINYYDKDINYIDSYTTITDGDVTIKQNNIPNGTKYIALSTKKEDTKNPFVVIGEAIPYINEKASCAFNSIPELRKDIGFSITEPKEIGFLYASDGHIATNQDYRNTGKVSLSDFTNLDIEAVISSVGALAVFYDKDGIIISTLTIAGTSSYNPSTVNIDLTESIYEDAEYVCVSTNFTQYPNNFHLYLYNSNSLQNLVRHINEKASYAFNSIPELREDIKELREDIGFSITEPKEIGFLYASNGNITTNQDYRNTGKVSLSDFTNLDIEAVISSVGALAVFYDKDGIIISTLTIAGISGSEPSTVNIDLTESIYEDAEYVCVSTNFIQYPNNFHLYLYNSNSLQNLVRHIQSEVHYLNGISIDWRNKKWCVIGDSITEHNFRTEKNYHDYINEMTGISVVNKGISGTGYIANNPFYNRVNASDFPTDCDVITIMGGINDAVSFGSDIPIGDITDTTVTSVCGGVNMVIDALEAKYPVYLPLGIVSPLPAKVDTSVFPNATYPNQYALVDNCRAEQITEKVKQIAEKRGYPFLDLFHTSGLRPWNDTCKQSLFKAGDKWDADGLHPNANGHKKIVNKYFEFLKTLIN